jgi:hypothetical protein
MAGWRKITDASTERRDTCFYSFGIQGEYPTRILPERIRVMKSQEEANKALVVEAFDTLFNERDYAAAEKFWSPQYIQHSAHNGREGRGFLISSKTLPPR